MGNGARLIWEPDHHKKSESAAEQMFLPDSDDKRILSAHSVGFKNQFKSSIQSFVW